MSNFAERDLSRGTRVVFNMAVLKFFAVRHIKNFTPVTVKVNATSNIYLLHSVINMSEAS